MVRTCLSCLCLLINFIAFIGCSPTYLPCRADFYRIKYTPDWVCVEKATAGQKMLTKKGIKNRLCCGNVRDRGHCWNETNKDGRWFMYDMNTSQDQGWPIEFYPEYIREDIFYKPITLRDLIVRRSKRKALRALGIKGVPNRDELSAY